MNNVIDLFHSIQVKAIGMTPYNSSKIINSFSLKQAAFDGLGSANHSYVQIVLLSDRLSIREEFMMEQANHFKETMNILLNLKRL